MAQAQEPSAYASQVDLQFSDIARSQEQLPSSRSDAFQFDKLKLIISQIELAQNLNPAAQGQDYELFYEPTSRRDNF